MSRQSIQARTAIVLRTQVLAYSLAQLVRGKEAFAACATLGAEAGPALGFAGLLIELSNAHFLFDSAPLDELAETAHGLLGRLAIS